MPNYPNYSSNYNPYSYQYPQYNNIQIPTQQPQQMPQIQNGGLVSVHNEAEARNYPIAIGTSITFKDENAPYVYTKTMGFSQLESPRFDKYRLVKEDVSEAQAQPDTAKMDLSPINSAIDALKGEIGDLWREIEGLKKKPQDKAQGVQGAKKKEMEKADE